LAAHFAERSDFAVVSLSLDNQYTMDTLHEFLAGHSFAYPVLCQYADTGSSGSYGWELERGIPTAFIIDPQGVIRAELYPEIELAETLTWLMDEAPSPVALAAQLCQEANGEVLARVSLTSPTHQHLEATLSVTQLIPQPVEDGSDQRSGYDILPVVELDGNTLMACFSEFGDYSTELKIPVAPDAAGVRIRLSLRLPGSETLHDGQGIVVEATDFLWLGK